MDVMSAPAATRSARRGLLVAGISGLAASAIGIVCCATPALVVVLGAVGLGAATTTIGTAIDVIALPLAFISIALIAIGIYRRTRRG
jgi:hypothetical protein